MKEVVIPKKFRERYNKIVDNKKSFYEFLSKPLPRTFRINTLKADKEKTLKRLEAHGFVLKSMPWFDLAFATNEERIGSTLEHFMGHIYIQELVSMLPPLTIREELEENKEVFVLDACAAPGSKTTQLSDFMHNEGLIIANDAKFERLKILKHNLEKLGCMNVVAINKDVRFLKWCETFDFILLDAPCSSEGTIRKNWNVLTKWSEGLINSLSYLQKQMIVKCFDLLKEEGALIYSTCTFAPEENECVLQHLLEKRNCKLETLKFKGLKIGNAIKEWKGVKFDSEIKKAVRIWPHHNDTGGFFIAKIRKVEK
jgi:NOL1/NOP2/sun family putative RNA methylase